jgi:hypothetical protein
VTAIIKAAPAHRRFERTDIARRNRGVTRRGTNLLVGILAVAVASCAGGPTTAPEVAQPLTPPQAIRLAQALHQNHEAGGATFRLVASDEATGGTITLEGAVDWTRSQGRATVQGHADELGTVVEIAWTADAVAELRPELVGELVTRGLDPSTFVLRPIDISGHPLDRLIAIVSGLATEQPDNAQLVIQNPGSGFVRSDAIRGVEVEVLRYSERSLLWIEPASGRLLRFEGTNALGGAPVVIDILELGPVGVELPFVTDLSSGAR